MEPTLLEKFRQSYRNLELFPLLTAEEIEAFRVDYGDDTIARLKQVVIDSDADGKIMFAGHRGCGKSTLLARFSRNMRDQGYFVVFFSIADLIELSAVNHVNILYTIAVMLLSEATKRQVAIPDATKKALLEWLTTTQTQTVTKDLKSEIGAGGDFFKVVTAKLKSESTFREEIKLTYEKRVSDLARKADEIAGAIQAVTKKEVLVLIDDLDKLDLALVQSIYRDNINSLFLPKFRIIFTIPISAIRNSELLAILLPAISSRIQQLEVVKFFKHGESHNPEAIPKEKAVSLFLQVLQKRIPNELIEPETARQLVLKSGGVIRELVRIARECCTQCLLALRSDPERQSIKIDDAILQSSLKDLRNDFARPLGTNLYDILVSVYEDLNPKDAGSDEFLSLLHGLYVLEYENDDLWYDVHPIVVDLLKRKKLIE